jgi:coenzyme F420-reducing hydrogenase gamma subunit
MTIVLLLYVFTLDSCYQDRVHIKYTDTELVINGSKMYTAEYSILKTSKKVMKDSLDMVFVNGGFNNTGFHLFLTNLTTGEAIMYSSENICR